LIRLETALRFLGKRIRDEGIMNRGTGGLDD